MNYDPDTDKLNYAIEELLDRIEELEFVMEQRLTPNEAIEKLEELLQWGLKKYPTPKWKQISIDEHLAAAERHLTCWKFAPGFGWRENKSPDEFTRDHESGMSHLIHAFARLAFAVTLESNEQAKTVANRL